MHFLHLRQWFNCLIICSFISVQNIKYKDCRDDMLNRGIASTASELDWFAAFLTELDISVEKLYMLLCDNLEATHHTENPIYHSQIKYASMKRRGFWLNIFQIHSKELTFLLKLCDQSLSRSSETRFLISINNLERAC